jgi:hypothetical protein
MMYYEAELEFLGRVGERYEEPLCLALITMAPWLQTKRLWISFSNTAQKSKLCFITYRAYQCHRPHGARVGYGVVETSILWLEDKPTDPLMQEVVVQLLVCGAEYTLDSVVVQGR